MGELRKRVWSARTAVALAAVALFGAAAPAQAARVVGLCTIVINEPHPSSHVSGNISSSGRVTCSIGMPEVFVTATLEGANGTTWPGVAENRVNLTAGRTLTSVSPISCRGNQGTYRTQVGIVLRAPAGVNPAYHSNIYHSIWRPVACGVSNARTASEPVSADEFEVRVAVREDGTVQQILPDRVEFVEASPEEVMG